MFTIDSLALFANIQREQLTIPTMSNGELREIEDLVIRN